ncbi:MAG TPA: fumarylacetoacetate hydrolase family protein [Thermomicrobiales bacterium]|nr:fumarylacetoacetate hydrolase family protein [Thermomicrobiales bacterium]
MQLVHFDDFRLGVLAGGRVADISDVVGDGGGGPQARLEALIRGWADLAPAVRAAADRGGVPLEGVRLRPSVPRPGQLVCAAVNYLEPGRPEPQPFNAFLKAPTSIIGDGDTVELPDTPATVFHFEPELALVIGRRAAHLAPEAALDHVFGYTPFIDVSARGLPGGFFLGKSWHTFAPLGPALVTADEVPDPHGLRVDLAVNGAARHTYSTGDMARRVPELLAAITAVIALEPGDVVATGVHHAGLAPIQGGDRVRLTIERLGPALEVAVHDAGGRTWG